MKHEYQKVLIGRPDGDDAPNYEIHGLPSGADFRDEDSYERLTATWLKVNGTGFSTAGAEFGEHGETVTVEQDRPGGAARIEV